MERNMSVKPRRALQAWFINQQRVYPNVPYLPEKKDVKITSPRLGSPREFHPPRLLPCKDTDITLIISQLKI